MLTTEKSCGSALSVLVFVPTCIDGRPFTWHKTKTVGAAADEVAAACEISAESPTFQTACDSILNRDQTLLDAGVENHDKLEFVSPGGGV